MKTRQQIISELQSSVTTLLASVKQNIFDNNIEYISGNRLQVELIEIINQLAQRVLDIANSYLNEDSDADVYSSYRRLFVVSQLLNLTTGTIPIGDVVSSQPTGNNIANFGDVAINTGDGVAYVFTSAQPNAWIPFDSILPITASSLISVTDGNAITVEASQILISSGITLTDNGAGVASISSVLSNASESVKGVVQEATQEEIINNVGIGDTGARLFVNPLTLEYGNFRILGKDVKLPQLTTTQRDALLGLANGSMLYNTTINEVQILSNSVWFNVMTNLLPLGNVWVGDVNNIAVPTTPYYNIVTRLQLVSGTITYTEATLTQDSYVLVTPTNTGLLTGTLRVTTSDGSLTITSSVNTDTAILMVFVIV